MSKLSFRNFTWPENPESFRVEAARKPIFLQNEAGAYMFSHLAGVKRVVSGSGVLTGPYAVDNYGELELQLIEGEAGELTLPGGEKLWAYLTELSMELDERDMFLRYSFAFREADENGIIP